jgi:hypothetical protein
VDHECIGVQGEGDRLRRTPDGECQGWDHSP